MMKPILLTLALSFAIGAPTPTLAAGKKTVVRTLPQPKTTDGTVGGTNGAVELTSWDCKAVGGTVVVVGDDRCGSSRRYCRMPDTNAVCIEEKLQ